MVWLKPAEFAVHLGSGVVNRTGQRSDTENGLAITSASASWWTRPIGVCGAILTCPT